MPSPAATLWLSATPTVTPAVTYHHFHLVENNDAWDGVRNELVSYFRSAHADAIQRLETLTGTSLHPAGEAPATPYSGYPCQLPQVTLQGYFGEIMAGWFAENHEPCGLNGWSVPAHLFRYHLTAFQNLEQLAQSGAAPGTIVGRTGDDCVAFRRNGTGTITDILYCEAKCTLTHNAGLIAEAHQKASASAIVDIPQLIEILLGRGDEDASAWVDALRALHFAVSSGTAKTIARHDLVCYVHGQAPLQRATWIPASERHTSYTAGRVLNAVELRLSNVLDRIGALYAPEVWT